jgi:hypothetical protein
MIKINLMLYSKIFIKKYTMLDLYMLKKIYKKANNYLLITYKMFQIKKKEIKNYKNGEYKNKLFEYIYI